MKAKDFLLRRDSVQLQTPNGRRQSVIAKAGPVFLKPIPSTGTKGGVLYSTRKNNNAFICFAALVIWFSLICLSFNASLFQLFSVYFKALLVVIVLYQKHYCTILSLDAKGEF